MKFVPQSRLREALSVLRILCIAGALLFAACLTDRIAGGSTSTETGTTKVSLSGRVVDKDNAGLAGVVVELSRTGIKDTTDAQGGYALTGKLDKNGNILALTAAGSAPSADIALDTLVVRQRGQQVAALPVFKWIDSLPDIKIIQRDISGKLLSALVSIGRVEAVISGDGIPIDQPMVIDLYHFVLSSSYTGFAYFKGTSALANYAVFVRVFDTLGSLVGQSPVVSFNSTAGNIPVPDFRPDNLLPKLSAGRDTVLTVGGRLTLRATAADPLGGGITRLEWDVGATGIFRQTTGDTTITLPLDTLRYPVILRAWNGEGHSSLDTAIVRTVRVAVCSALVMKFHADDQFCRQFWTADLTGLATTIAFEIDDTLIVKVLGSPIGLPTGYSGPYPPAEQYIGLYKPQGKKGTTQVRVLATRSDQSKQYYNTWTIIRY